MCGFREHGQVTPLGIREAAQTMLDDPGARRRLLQFPNVRIRERCDALELVHDRDRNRVTGVEVAPREGSKEMISSDLVVDASGRGSRSPSWLGATGYAKPREEQIKVNIGYKKSIRFSGSVEEQGGHARSTHPVYQDDRSPMSGRDPRPSSSAAI